MKLTSDESSRLTSPELFPPKTTFDVSVGADGAIHLVQSREAPLVKPRRVNGRLRGARIELNREIVAAAARAERDSR
jgi:hypothetical protein